MGSVVHPRRIERSRHSSRRPPAVRRSRIEIIVTDREQCFVLRGCALHGVLPLPQLTCERPLRRFTISNYNDYVHLLRGKLLFPLPPPPVGSMSRFSEGSARKRRTRREQIARGFVRERGSDQIYIHRAAYIDQIATSCNI